MGSLSLLPCAAIGLPDPSDLVSNNALINMIVNNMPKPLNTKGIAADFDVLRASAHGRTKGSC